MTLFLNGGGCGEQIKESYKIFKEKINTSRPLLYIPLAMDKDKYPGCLEWITQELAMFHFPQIDMISSAKELCSKKLEDYAAIFIGGGCTYKLLSELKSCSAYQKIQDFFEHDGIVFGGSAGAIIFGKNIDSCRHDDANTVNLRDTTGFDQVFGAYVGAHYPNNKPERMQKATTSFAELSHNAPVVSLPEEDTLIIDKDIVQVIGSQPYHIFQNGTAIQMAPNQIYSTSAFKDLLKGVTCPPFKEISHYSR